MLKLSRPFVLCAIFSYSGFVYSDSEMIRIHPDEPPSHTHSNRFSSENAIETLQIIGESLASFRKITEAIAAKEPIILNRYKHTDWEMQNIGFANALTTIEGAMLQQKYLIAQLKYKIAIEKKDNSNGVETFEVGIFEREFQDARSEYEAFLENTKIID